MLAHTTLEERGARDAAVMLRMFDRRFEMQNVNYKLVHDRLRRIGFEIEIEL